MNQDMPRFRARLAIAAGLIAVIVISSAVAVALAGRGQTPATSIEIDIRYSAFNPSEITVPVGVPITITLRNGDPIDHEWIVGDEAVHAVHRVSDEPLHPDRPTEVVLPAMTSTTTVVTFQQAGSLAFICHLPDHEKYGMRGTVTIR
jgi:uncharacterized cupredoxin-like copper-binding protein